MTELQSSRLRPRGSNHVGMRQFNERVVLQAIRLHGALPKAEIARLTHLTPQTVQLIIGRLEGDGLVVKQAPVRGKVGQPSVPMALNPDGAFSIGIKIGRRGMDMLLVDFTGQVRERLVRAHAFPDPRTLFDEIADGLAELRGRLGPERARVLHGVGVAAPLSLGGWESLLGLSADAARAWALIDIRARVAALTELPVVFVKDTAAACVAELVAGRGRSMRSYLYVFVDTFIGGGLVLDSHLRSGRTGNAGAIGSMSMGMVAGQGEPPRQLLSVASLFTLEKMYADAGLDAAAVADARAVQAPWLAVTQQWLAQCAPGIALAAHNAAALLDIESVIIDGSFSRELLATTLTQVDAALDRYDWEGLSRPSLMAGAIGADARAIGGALLPLHESFAPDRDLFLKDDA